MKKIHVTELNASLADCFQAGIVMFAAAGNRADSHPGISFPANNQHVIAVGATNENDGDAPIRLTGTDVFLIVEGANAEMS